MGLVYADLDLVSVDDLVLYRKGYIKKEDIKNISIRSLVESGAYLLCIDENIKGQLDLSTVDRMNAEMADGRIENLEVVGPVEIRFKNRKTVANAVVLPGSNEVLLGSIPMEDLDVVINPKTQTIEVNPEAPFISKKKIK